MKRYIEMHVCTYYKILAPGKRSFDKKVMLGIMAMLLLMQQVQAEEKFSFGAGIGAMYSGLGVKLGLKTDRQLKYLSLGCLGYKHNSENRDSACGAGVGIIRTDLFAADNDKHGLGLYVGTVGSANESDPKVIYGLGSMTVVYEIKPVYGIGISYVYFWDGILDKGLNLGITPAIGFDNGAKGSVLLQVGYQFR